MRWRHWTVLVTMLAVASFVRWARADDGIVSGRTSPADGIVSGRTSPADRVHVVYWEKWTGFEKDAIQTVVDDYNRSQDRIFVDLVSVSVIRQKTLLATAGGNPPDLA